MPHRIKHLLALGLMAGSFPLLVLGGTKVNLDDLLKSNPFWGSDSANTPQAKAPQFELRGVMVEKGVYWFNVYDTGTKKSAWVQRGALGATFAVKDYDIARETLTLESRGQRLALSLRESGLESFAGAAPGAVAAAAGSPAPATMIALSYVPAVPESEKLRLDQVALAVQQRREQRLKAAGGIAASKI